MMEALLKGLKSCAKGTIACQEMIAACPQNSKASLEVIEAAIVTFEDIWQMWRPQIWMKIWNKLNPLWSGRNSVKKKRMWALSCHWMTDTWNNSWLHQWVKKQTQGNGGSGQSWLPPENGRYARPSLQCPGRDSTGRGIPKGRTSEKRLRICRSGIMDRSARKHLCQRMGRTSDGIFRKFIKLQI